MEANDSRLEYIKIIAHQYAISMSDITIEEINKGESDYAKYVIDASDSDVASYYSGRYEELHEENKDAYNIYKENEDIQSAIKQFGLDSEILWETILFAKDHAFESVKGYTRKEMPSARDIAEKMLKKFDMESTSITIKSNLGEYTTNNDLITSTIRNCIENIIEKGDIRFDDEPIDDTVTRKDFLKHELAFFTKMINYLLENKYPAKQPSKFTFIAKLAYILKYVDKDKYGMDNSKFLTGYEYKEIKSKNDNILARQNGKAIIDGKEYYKNLVNSGKLLKDLIKNYNDSEDIFNSPYTYSDLEY